MRGRLEQGGAGWNKAGSGGRYEWVVKLVHRVGTGSGELRMGGVEQGGVGGRGGIRGGVGWDGHYEGCAGAVVGVTWRGMTRWRGVGTFWDRVAAHSSSIGRKSRFRSTHAPAQADDSAEAYKIAENSPVTMTPPFSLTISATDGKIIGIAITLAPAPNCIPKNQAKSTNCRQCDQQVGCGLGLVRMAEGWGGATLKDSVATADPSTWSCSIRQTFCQT